MITDFAVILKDTIYIHSSLAPPCGHGKIFIIKALKHLRECFKV